MVGSVVAVLLPVVVLLGLGFVLRRRVVQDGAFWSGTEKLCYNVLLPALFVHGFATADLSGLPVRELVWVLVAATAVVASLVVLLRPVLSVDGAGFTSVFQGSIRFNNYIGITIAAGLFGARGVALAAVCNMIVIPTVNLLCVLVFAGFGGARPRVRDTLREIGTNPLILGCLGGLALRLLGGMPPVIGPVLEALGRASMPLGLLCVGGALQLQGARRWTVPIVVSSLMKFVALPAATILVAASVGLAAPVLAVAVLFQALPTASSSYILSRRLGGDAPMMAAIITAQTALGMVAVPLVLATLQL